MEYVTLYNDVKVPVLGIGTFMISPEDTENSVYAALKGGGCDIIGTNQRKPSKIKGLQMI